MTEYQQLEIALQRLETALEEAGLWRMTPPEASAFTSKQPFCVDTMTLPQWLRFVFIPRLGALAEAQGSLPARCEVAPALETYLQQANVPATERVAILRTVEEVDRLVTEN
ncbi:YqcC family protein [Halomonas sediminis]|uniref:YqcC family protein n=1 Tax=Vreelandella zhuhanensis TaxID=2684210 RepID=A0A7X3KSH0_9GAMM|nr:YqcC family protein [Halomonas zhuhanensis]MWJ29341.1 YqcC family protein [Halomonas zhuhanensis]